MESIARTISSPRWLPETGCNRCLGRVFIPWAGCSHNSWSRGLLTTPKLAVKVFLPINQRNGWLNVMNKPNRRCFAIGHLMERRLIIFIGARVLLLPRYWPLALWQYLCDFLKYAPNLPPLTCPSIRNSPHCFSKNRVSPTVATSTNKWTPQYSAPVRESFNSIAPSSFVNVNFHRIQSLWTYLLSVSDPRWLENLKPSYSELGGISTVGSYCPIRWYLRCSWNLPHYFWCFLWIQGIKFACPHTWSRYRPTVFLQNMAWRVWLKKPWWLVASIVYQFVV